MKILILLLAATGIGYGQRIQGGFVVAQSTDPSGACTSISTILNTTNGKYWGCIGSVWTQVSGSGGAIGATGAVQSAAGGGAFADSGCTATSGSETCSTFIANGSGTGIVQGGPTVSGTNQAGNSLNVAGGQSTGSAAGGAVHVQYSLAGSSGTSTNALTDAFVADPATGRVTFTALLYATNAVLTTPALGTPSAINLANATNFPVRRIAAYVFDGGGTPLSGTLDACVDVPIASTITGVTLLSDVSGSATVDVKTVAYASYAGPSSASSITASAVPAISSAFKYQDTTLTGWTTAVAANTVMCFHLTSPTASTWIMADVKGN